MTKAVKAAQYPPHSFPGREDERRKLWMRFYRSRQGTASSRKRKMQCCPAHLKEIMTSKPDSISAFFDLWIGCSGDWGKVEVYVRKYKKNFTRGEAVKRWLTEAQITDHYKDEDVAMDVMNASPSRPNPAAPNSAKAKQNHVTVMDDQVKGTETGDETGIAGHGELDAEHCKDANLKQMLDIQESHDVLQQMCFRICPHGGHAWCAAFMRRTVLRTVRRTVRRESASRSGLPSDSHGSVHTVDHTPSCAFALVHFTSILYIVIIHPGYCFISRLQKYQ